MSRTRPLATPGGVDALSATAAALAAARIEILEAANTESLVAVLAELRKLETEAEVRILRLYVSEHLRDQGEDRVLDTKATASLIGRSVDWVNKHRYELRSALVSGPGTRPRYSQRQLTNWINQSRGRR